jgi:hypothetical protein
MKCLDLENHLKNKLVDHQDHRDSLKQFNYKYINQQLKNYQENLLHSIFKIKNIWKHVINRLKMN